MAALTAASWTLTLDSRHPKRVNGMKVCRGTLLLAGVDTYPGAGGIPLPAKEKFGFIREMNDLALTALTALTTEYLARYNKADHKLMLFVSHDTAGVTTLPLDEEDSAGVPGARTWRFEAWGW